MIKQGRKETRTFSTMTDDLLDLADWLAGESCTHVAMESTGVYWKPVFNLLEGVMEVILVNARHVKAIPGRKTDVKDCEWLADLLRHGLLKASFIPPRHIRESRELTRYRQSLVKERQAVANRIQKLLESANIKLGQVASDALGVSAQAMLEALIAGESSGEEIAQLAQGQLKEKEPVLRKALKGWLTSTQRWVLGELLDHYRELEGALERAKEQIQKEVANSPDPSVDEAIELLDTIPGVGQQAAQTIVAEVGVDMSRFPSSGHLSSWAGVCPGNHESAGKVKSGKTTKGNPYLAAQYRRLVRRMGKKKALIAVVHSLLVIVYQVLSRKVPYAELGGDYFDHRNVDTQRRRLVRRLEGLGLKVTVEELGAAA